MKQTPTSQHLAVTAPTLVLTQLMALTQLVVQCLLPTQKIWAQALHSVKWHSASRRQLLLLKLVL
jgi:hypothetical protein